MAVVCFFFGSTSPSPPKMRLPKANPSPSSGHWGSPATHLVLHGCGGVARQGSGLSAAPPPSPSPPHPHPHPHHHPHPRRRRRRVSPPRRQPRRQAPTLICIAPLPLAARSCGGHAPPAPSLPTASLLPLLPSRGGAEGGAAAIRAGGRWGYVA